MKIQDLKNRIENRVEELKSKNCDLNNFKLVFNKTAIVLRGDFEDQEFGAGDVANFYIPTNKGYISAEWKKTKFFKMTEEEVNDELLKELAPYFQEKDPTIFVRPTQLSAATAIANHINANGGDPYDRG